MDHGGTAFADGAGGPAGPVDVGDDGERAVLAAIMARMAEGDGAAVFTLIDRYQGELARLVRRIAAGRRARLRAQEVSDLVTEVALVLFDLAPAWKPDGAPPWLWARHRIANLVDRHLGQWTDSIEAAGIDLEQPDRQGGPGAEPSVLEVLTALAHDHPEVALLLEALGLVASPRDQLLFFETALQVDLGDRSPAATVADLVGMRPEAVRQQVHRVRARVRRLASSEPRFAPLADLPLVA